MKNIKIPEYFNSSKKNPAKRLAGSLLIIWHATAKKVKLFFIQFIQPLKYLPLIKKVILAVTSAFYIRNILVFGIHPKPSGKITLPKSLVIEIRI